MARKQAGSGKRRRKRPGPAAGPRKGQGATVGPPKEERSVVVHRKEEGTYVIRQTIGLVRVGKPRRAAAAPLPLPRPGVTSGGRLIRSTAAERRARGAALRDLLAGFDAAPLGADDAPEVWEAVRRGIDEGRPHRPLFGGGAGG